MSQTVHSDRDAGQTDTDRLAPTICRGSGSQQTSQFPFLRPPATDDEIGRLGNYRVIRLIGAGGMGKVFLAEDIALARPVALKVMCLSDDLLGTGGERFLREARTLASIRHPHLVGVYQAGEDNGTVFLAMELLEGETLEARLRREAPLEPSEVLRIGRETAAGLAAIHERGLIHRDIKPANIWLEAPTARVRILDFGLVRTVHEDTQLTEAGMVVGTPAYMSPEQVRCQPLDHRTDLFSFGCVLYALCTGRPPFAADNAMAQAAALAADDPARVRKLNRAIPKSLSDLIAELLAKNPDARPPSAAVVIERLRDIEHGRAEGEEEPEAEARPHFFRRHAVKLVAAVWLAVAVLLAIGLANGRGKTGPDSRDSTTAPQPAPTESEPVYLSDLSPLRSASWPLGGPGAPPWPPGTDGSVVVRGNRSPHGIFMHPARAFDPPASATYKLGGGYAAFAAAVAFNDSALPFAPPVRFAVYLDGKPKWDSGPLGPKEDARTCRLDVRGASELTIAVTCDADPRGAHAVWIEPRLVK